MNRKIMHKLYLGLVLVAFVIAGYSKNNVLYFFDGDSKANRTYQNYHK